jgi:hypothetical protein
MSRKKKKYERYILITYSRKGDIVLVSSLLAFLGKKSRKRQECWGTVIFHSKKTALAMLEKYRECFPKLGVNLTVVDIRDIPLRRVK